MAESDKPADEAPKQNRPGAWERGKSGNPNGRKPVGATVAEVIRKKYPAEKLVKLIGDIAENGEKDQDRLKAATFLMERAYPAPPAKFNVEHSGGISSNVSIALPPAMSPEEYAAFVAGALRPSTSPDHDDTP